MFYEKMESTVDSTALLDSDTTTLLIVVNQYYVKVDPATMSILINASLLHALQVLTTMKLKNNVRHVLQDIRITL